MLARAGRERGQRAHLGVRQAGADERMITDPLIVPAVAAAGDDPALAVHDDRADARGAVAPGLPRLAEAHLPRLTQRVPRFDRAQPSLPQLLGGRSPSRKVSVTTAAASSGPLSPVRRQGVNRACALRLCRGRDYLCGVVIEELTDT